MFTHTMIKLPGFDGYQVHNGELEVCYLKYNKFNASLDIQTVPKEEDSKKEDESNNFVSLKFIYTDFENKGMNDVRFSLMKVDSDTLILRYTNKDDTHSKAKVICMTYSSLKPLMSELANRTADIISTKISSKHPPVEEQIKVQTKNLLTKFYQTVKTLSNSSDSSDSDILKTGFSVITNLCFILQLEKLEFINARALQNQDTPVDKAYALTPAPGE